MRFNRLFLTQGNPSWADYYVHYRRLRTLVKKMVFTWHKGALWQVPVRYGVDDAPVLYSTAELIPPKLPADDSDSDGDDEALDGPSPLPSDVAAAADAAATAAVTAAATAGGAGAGERSPLLPTVATSLLARVDPATLTKKQAKQLKKQLRKEEKHRRRAAVAAANVATPTDGGRYGSGGNGDDDDDDDDDIERGPKTNSGGGYGSLATMFSPAASSHTETPVSDRWSPASGSVTGSGISASPLTPRAGAGASGLKPGKGKGKKNRSGASGTSGALSPYGPPPGFDGPNMTMSGVRYRKIARSRYNTLTSVNGASTGTGIAGAGGSNAWPPLPPLPAPSAAAGRLPLSAAAGAGAFGAGGYSGYNAGGSNGGSGFGGSYGNGSGVGGYNNGSEGARLSKKDRKKLKKAEKKVRRQQELHRLIGASPFASPSPASSGPGAAGTAGASVGAGAGAVIRVNGQTPLLVSPSAAAAAAAAGGKKGGSKGAKKPEKEDEEEGDDHFDVERGPPSKDRQSKGLPSISAADPSSSVAAETHEAAVASLAAALDSPHAIPDSALVAVAPSGLTLNSGGGLSLSHVAPSRAGGLGSNGVSASGAMNGSGVKGLSLRVQSSPSLTALAQLAAAKDVAATAAGTAKDAAAAPAGPDAAAGAGAIPLTASDLFFSPAGTNPSVLAQIAASGNKLTAKSTTTAAVTGTGASSSGTEPHAQQPPSVSRPLSSVPSLSKSPSVIGAGPAAGTATGVAGISAGSQQQQQSANPSPLSTAAAAAAAATDAPSLPSLPPPHMSWAQSGSQSLASGSQSLAHGSSQSRASPYHSAAAQESAQAQALALSPAHSAGVRAPVKAAIGAVTSAAASAASVAASAASAVASVLRPHSRAQDHHPVEPEAAGGGGGGAVVDADADADADGASGNSAPVLTSASRPTKATAMSNPQVEVYEGMMRDFWHQMRLDYEHVDAFYRSTVSALTVGMERVGNTSRDVYGRRPLYMPSDGGSNGGSYQYQNQQYGPGGGDSSDPASSPSGGGGGGGDEAHYYVPDEARYGALLAIYETICELRLFCSLNTTALRKLLKKYEKYSPKVQTAAGAKIPVSAPLTSKFAAQLRVSSFVTQDDLRALTAQVFSQVARDKLFAIESHVMTKRLNGDSDAGGAHGVKSGLFRTVKVVPLLVSLALFLAILWLPLDLPHSPAADAAVVTTGTAAAGASTGALKLPHAAAPKLLTLNGAGAGTGTDTDTDADADLDGNADANPENVAATAALAAAFEPVDDAAIAALLSPTLSGSSSSMSARAPDAGAGPATVVAARTAPVAPAPVQGQGQGQGGNAAPGVVAGAPGAGAKKKAAPKRVAPQLISNQAHKCLALLVFAISMWVSEAIPYFCTGMLIPILIVMCGLAVDPATGEVLPVKEAAHYVAGHIFNHTTFLILLGFAVSAAFCKAQLELRIAEFFQTRLGHSPQRFILGVMLLGLFLSMWINNHTAPIICVSFLTPIMQDFGKDSRFNRALMLGLTFGCNFGGMVTPIASLHNVLAVSALAAVGIEVSFGSWMLVAVPFSLLCTVLCWAYLCYVERPDDVDEIPLVIYDKQPLSSLHFIVLGSTALAVGGLAFMPYAERLVGGVPVLALLYLVTMFSLNILTVVDFNSFNWHMLILIGGGSILGDVIKSSHLLEILAKGILDLLSGPTYVQYAQIVLIITVVTSCISHTVGAIILMPLLVQLGLRLGIPTLLTFSCALAISGAMALPFSSFPNLNALTVRSETGSSYLTPGDLIKRGVPLTLLSYLLIVTVGFLLIVSAIPSGLSDVFLGA